MSPPTPTPDSVPGVHVEILDFYPTRGYWGISPFYAGVCQRRPSRKLARRSSPPPTPALQCQGRPYKKVSLPCQQRWGTPSHPGCPRVPCGEPELHPHPTATRQHPPSPLAQSQTSPVEMEVLNKIQSLIKPMIPRVHIKIPHHIKNQENLNLNEKKSTITHQHQNKRY